MEVYSTTCDEGTPVRMSELNYILTKLHFNIEMNLQRGDTVTPVL